MHEVATLGRRGLDGDAIDVPTYARLEPLPGVDPSAKSPARWRDFDLPTLREAALVDPNDTRIAFYLARTLQAVELDDEALDAYARRVGMGGWYQEVFFSHYERGRLLATKPDGDPTDAYLEAAAVDPDRAEPYAALAEWHDGKANACPGAGAGHRACKLQHRAAGYVYAKGRVARAPAADGQALLADERVRLGGRPAGLPARLLAGRGRGRRVLDRARGRQKAGRPVSGQAPVRRQHRVLQDAEREAGQGCLFFVMESRSRRWRSR